MSRIFVVGSFVQAMCWPVERLPLPGESVAASGFFTEPGGKGLNMAVAAHRLGVAVDLLLAVGDDAWGAALRQRLADEGLSTALVHTLPGPSGCGVALIGECGHNMIAIDFGANARLGPAQADAARSAITAARLVYGQFEVGDAALARAFRLAREAGVATVLNPSPWRAIAPALLADTDVLLLNEQEAADWRVSGGVPGAVPTLVVTQGAAGCTAWPRGEAPITVPAPEVAAVDTTGCGDAFSAGFCSALAEGLPLEAALRRGNACGAHLAARRGVLAVLPTRAELGA